MKTLIRKLIFKIKFNDIFSYKKYYLKVFGMHIGKTVEFKNSIKSTWPHKVSIGNNCIFEDNIYFKYDGIYSEDKAIIIGNNCFFGQNVEFNIQEKIIISDYVLVGSGTKFVDHNHGILVNEKIKNQPCPSSPIIIEEDVWLGFNCVILPGIRISKGSIIGSSSVVTKNIPPNEIWAGVPAKKIGDRL